jgi:hypothetical protein
MKTFAETIETLWRTIEARRGADPARSWSARLIADPPLAASRASQ